MITIDGIRAFLDAYPYTEEMRDTVLDGFRRLADNEDFSALVATYTQQPRATYSDLNLAIDRVGEVSEAVGISPYLGNLVLLIAWTPVLKCIYLEEDLPLDMLHATLADLYYKTLECIAVQGCVGTFVAKWHVKIFKLELFAHGRLQFEPITLSKDTVVGDVTLPMGTRVFSVHIPRTLTPLDHDAVEDAYRRADAFFRARGMCEHTVFFCSSWLLFPRHREMLREGSNIVRFLSDYTITESGEYETFGDLWRLFDCKFTTVDALPQDTSIRRAYVDLIRRGERTGWGRGFILYS